MTSPIDPEILRQIKTILRRDLKLAPDAPLAEDMPFFGGEVDLDSLDMLLLGKQRSQQRLQPETAEERKSTIHPMAS